MWRNVNDDLAHADQLIRLINKIPCRVNLIRFHAIPGVDLVPSSDEKMIIFRNYLNSKGVLSTIRTSRGEDIEAACGMLAAKHKKATNQ
jgi:23S rRNA (adenine2503-C2)-methyltransferase